ncbi:hydrolase 2, exosortase A system-associated [Aestuariibacter halophilus]|uniref:Hydrolase 2, exosortase A system-associated n=1 Tax=Fluctibacter halophilus TaxID=226011 RepID=A0ABS8G2W6_9ALTE|nr:hydrolase 2, exosortase A system-associated [Aestuariibacter halophilus]MCC2614875.1 hydrolase 2, exosortase A system-associated [Aestuariibacter halophilus]
MSLQRIPVFMPLNDAELFCFTVRPQGQSNGALLFIPPFAEEMNKSRKMMTLMMEAAAQAGYESHLLDVYGTGDSAGDFGQASWQHWVDDLVAWISAWRAQQPDLALQIVALRSGALLCNAVCEQLTDTDFIARIHYWQPVFNGTQFVNQFLRLRLAADMIKQDSKPLTVKDLRAQLQQDGRLEVAGYTLQQALIDGLEGAPVTPSSLSSATPLHVYEVSGRGQLTPALSKAVTSLEQQYPTRVHTLIGPSFWNAQEIALCDDLINTTLTALNGEESADD